MTAQERFLTVLKGGIPDRVPSFELLVDRGFRKAVNPELDFYDFQEAMGFDMVLFGLGSSDEPTKWENQEKQIFRDKWGVRQQFTGEMMPSIIDQSPRIGSLEELSHYHPPDPAHPAMLNQVRNVVTRFKGKMAIGFLGEATFAVQQYLRGGLEQLMIDYALGEELPKRIAVMAADYYCELYRNVIREGVEVIVLGDDYAGKSGPFMSPAHFREYIYPGLKRVVQTCKQAGARVIKHSDGDLWKLLDMIVESGVDALGPLEPLPTMRLSRIKAAYPKVTVVGNIDVALLSTGTADQVRQRTRECLADAAPGGRFILSSGNSIASSVQPELYRTMVATKNRHGDYPMPITT
ncbi:MAG: uroporphyrinogen decarboxylase family protein [Verrucomicrobiota bacterium]